MEASRPPQGAPNMDVFEAYFNRADLDRDGRISGAETVAFFQGSNLPKHVLAQIWTYANQNQTGFLGRPEFFNALRLVTVAQSGRELTPDIVKAALGPAAAKIPAPQINPVSAPSAQMNPMATSANQSNVVLQPSSQIGGMGPSAFLNSGNRGQQALSNMGMNQQSVPSVNNHLRPLQGTQAAASVPMQGVGQAPSRGGMVAGPHFPGSNTPNLSTDWLGNRSSGAAAGPTSQLPNRGVTPVSHDGFGLAQMGMAPGVTPKPPPSAPSPSIQPKPFAPAIPSSQPAPGDSRASVLSGNGVTTDSVFGRDVFSAAPQTNRETSAPFPARSLPSTSNTLSGSQNITKPGQPNYLQNKSGLASGGSLVQSESVVGQNQMDNVQSKGVLATSNVSVRPVASASNDSQPSWPKMTESNIHKYNKVFVEVDKDRDGKITGEEARNLFLSWRLPREVLKQVWDLSDQDNDSMLSLREFCTALYLMERYREGRPLPAVLPDGLRFDEMLLRLTGQPSTAYAGSAWQQHPGYTQQGVSGPRHVMHSTVMKPPRAPLPSVPEESVQPQQQKSRVPVLEKNLVDQLSEDEQKTINSKLQEATEADKKVQELEKEILDCKEKTEFYRTKMQELVLYKSRCDNRLNEIMERVSADKHEVESLAKKYEDKFKQSGDVASKLTLDEATFRDIQERKLELYNAIVKMEQGGTSDGALQDRVNKIQSDLEELVKTLNERCKQYGLRGKPTSLVELPFGWQPGIQEGTADWDEDWDKFNEEGFSIIKELTVDVENIVAKPESPPVRSDKNAAVDLSTTPTSDENKIEAKDQEVSTVSTSFSDENKVEMEKPSGTGGHGTEGEPDYAQSENGSAKSPHDTPKKRTLEVSSPNLQSKQSGIEDHSPRTKENQSNHGGAESVISGDRYFDEPSWGARFDSDDTDSVWGFSTINSKEFDHERGLHDSFGLGDFGLNPIKTGSPGAESMYGGEKKGPLFDSVPSTPQYNSSFSPRFSEGPEDHTFDRFSRFDSFNMSEGGLFAHDSLSRFDSMSNTADPPTFARFDSMRSTTDAPPFGTLSRFDSMSSTADPSSFGTLARFDSIRSTADYGGGFPSFDDADPFGSSGPFKSSDSRARDADPFGSSGPFKSPEGQTPRRSNDSWSAF